MGVPFLFGVFPVLLAIFFACCIKEKDEYVAVKKKDSETTTVNHI